MKWLLFKEKLNKFLNDYYRPLSIAMAVVVLIVGSLSLIWPQYNQLKTKGMLEQKEAKRILAERTQYLDSIEQMKSQYDKLSFRAWQSLEYILPQQNEIYLLFAQLESLAKENKVFLSSINITDNSNTAAITGGVASQPPAAVVPNANPNQAVPNNIQTTSININISGLNSYEQFKQFLNNIENNIRLLDISSISYEPSTNAYSLTFTTYYLKNKTALQSSQNNEGIIAGQEAEPEFYAPQ